MSRLTVPGDWTEIPVPAYIAALVPADCSVEAFKTPLPWKENVLAVIYPADGEVKRNAVISLTADDIALEPVEFEEKIMKYVLKGLYRA